MGTMGTTLDPREMSVTAREIADFEGGRLGSAHHVHEWRTACADAGGPPGQGRRTACFVRLRIERVLW